MKRLSQSDYERALELQQKIEEMHEKLDDAVRWFNDKQSENFATVERALEELNEAIDTADSFRDDVSNSITAYYDERSEKWQESDAGQGYSQWKDAWEQSVDRIDLDEPASLEVPELDTVNLSELPIEPD